VSELESNWVIAVESVEVEVSAPLSAITETESAPEHVSVPARDPRIDVASAPEPVSVAVVVEV
jgi:hypothetical protein